MLQHYQVDSYSGIMKKLRVSMCGPISLRVSNQDLLVILHRGLADGVKDGFFEVFTTLFCMESIASAAGLSCRDNSVIVKWNT